MSIAESPIISKKFAALNVMAGVQAPRDRRRRPRRSVQTVDPQCPIGRDEDLFVIDAITPKPGKKSEIYCTMKINGQPVEIKIDTGAKCNVSIYSKGSAAMRRLIRRKQYSWLPMAGTR